MPGFEQDHRRTSGRRTGPSGQLALLAFLLCTAGAAGALAVFLYGQLREAEAAAARAVQRGAELERSAKALGTRVEGLERREVGLTQQIDELSLKQRTRDAAQAERNATLESLQGLLLPLTKRGGALVLERPEGLEVHFAERALFLSGSPHLSAGGGRLLRRLGDTLTDTHWRVEVVGRGPSLLTGTLEQGAAAARLGAERAASVSVYLVRSGGLPTDRVTAGLYAPVRRPRGEPPGVRRSSVEVRLLPPAAEFDRPAGAAASLGVPPAHR